MIRPILVDSSWYIRQAKQGYDPLKLLAEISEFRDVATCGVIMSEVGRGLRFPVWLERYQLAWRDMLYVDSSKTVWDITLALLWDLDRCGKVLPLQDVHIAACAKQISAVILTYNAHFDGIPGVKTAQELY